MKILITILLNISFLALISCTSNLITEKDNNKTIEYQLDTPFQIRLEKSIASQAEWKLISNNEPVILLKNILIDSTSTKYIYTFNFMTKSFGKEKIIIVYGTKNEPLKMFVLNVISGTMGRILSE